MKVAAQFAQVQAIVSHKFVQYSCLTPSLEAARQKIGRGGKGAEQKGRTRKVWRQSRKRETHAGSGGDNNSRHTPRALALQ